MSGLTLPDKPDEPLPSDCCNSGCTPCILDVYEDLVVKWKETCSLIQSGSVVNSAVGPITCPALSKTKYLPFKIIAIIKDTEDTYLYRFQAVRKALSNSSSSLMEEPEYSVLNQVLEFQPTQHLILQGNYENDGEIITVSRPYTLISGKNSAREGCFDIVIKLYDKGKMSQFVRKLTVGDVTHWRGPYGGFSYNRNTYKRVLMLCVGSGIAPMYALALSIVNDDMDDTVVKLMYGCRDVDNIILRKPVHSLCSYWNFSADIYISHPGKSQNNPLYGEALKTGQISASTVASELTPPNNENTLVLICGTPTFCTSMDKYVKNCGVAFELIHIF